MRKDFATHQHWAGSKHKRHYIALGGSDLLRLRTYPYFRCWRTKCKAEFSSGILSDRAENVHELYAAAVGKNWYFTDFAEYCPKHSRWFWRRWKYRADALAMKDPTGGVLTGAVAAALIGAIGWTISYLLL